MTKLAADARSASPRARRRRTATSSASCSTPPTTTPPPAATAPAAAAARSRRSGWSRRSATRSATERRRDAPARARGPGRRAGRQARDRRQGRRRPPRQDRAAIIASSTSASTSTRAGPTGNGPAPTVIANSTGCSSVYASTMPFNSYLDPWVNSLFQDAQPLAKGIFEGICGPDRAATIRALRLAELELDDAYDPAVHDPELRMLSRGASSRPRSCACCPTVMTIGGDGATYDIGFGAMSRVLAGGTPDQDAGAQHRRLLQHRRPGLDGELHRPGLRPRALRRGAPRQARDAARSSALLASFHPDVFACVTSTALHGALPARPAARCSTTRRPAVMDVYTPCGTEHGIAEDLSNARSRLAVESRMSPLFVHDPRRGSTLHERFSLDGNPDVDKTWTTSTLEYVDDDGPAPAADHAADPGRVRARRGPVQEAVHAASRTDDEDARRPDRRVRRAGRRPSAAARIPFVYATDDDKHLIKVACSHADRRPRRGPPPATGRRCSTSSGQSTRRS